MNKIQIDKRFNILIVEKLEGDLIPKESYIFCGSCGEPIGRTIEDISFPFNAKQLKANCTDWTIDFEPLGIKHTTCGHTLFAFDKEWKFVSYDKYISDLVNRLINRVPISQIPKG